MLKRIVAHRILTYLDQLEKIVENQASRVKESISVVDIANNEFTPEELKKIRILNSKINLLGMFIVEKVNK